MLITDLIVKLRNQIGDNDPTDYRITDSEMTDILNNAASEYSRMKSYVKFYEVPYDNSVNVYSLPTDCFKVKSVQFKNYPSTKINFIDNLDQIILEDSFDVQSETLKITYFRFFSPEEIIDREVDVFLIYAEALCYKLLSAKTADLIKFSTGEKTVDESLISAKYLELYECTAKKFKHRMIKAYGRRANNPEDNLDYDLPYPPLGETP